MVLTAVGVYGLINVWTHARTREMGIRMALGARPAQVVAMIVLAALRLAVAGVVVGGAAALVLTRAMGSMLYGVPAADAPTYLLLAGLMLAMTAAAALVPAARAVRADPLRSLRAE